MTTRAEIEAWVKEALACKDQEYQLVEVVRTAIELEADRCAKIAETHCNRAHYMGDSTASDIAKQIRAGVGLTIKRNQESGA